MLNRKLESFENATLKGEAQRLQALVLAERAHDPERTLERGYALVADEDGDPVTSAAAARERDRVAIRFADDAVPALASRTAMSAKPESYEAAVARLEEDHRPPRLR